LHRLSKALLLSLMVAMVFLNNCTAMGSKRSLRQAEVFLRRKQARTTQNVDSMVWQMDKPR